jgi:hypothetical protein
MDQHDLHRAIDACRPTYDDLQLEEMAALAGEVQRDQRVRQMYERSQRLDVALGAAFQDVPVPEGFAERLLAAVAAETAVEKSDSNQMVDRAVSSASETPADTESAVSPAKSRARLSRRWLAVVGSVVAATAAMLLVGLLLLHDTQAVGRENLAGQARDWTDQVILEDIWHLDITQAPTKRYPRNDSVRAAAVRWRWIATQYSSKSVCYAMTTTGTDEGFQFVVPTNKKFNVPATLPATPISTTGNRSVGACHHNGVLYVLVVTGDVQRYQMFLKPPTGFAHVPVFDFPPPPNS